MTHDLVIILIESCLIIQAMNNINLSILKTMSP